MTVELSNASGRVKLIGGGQTGELIRSKEWSLTPLGPIERWPTELTANVQNLLSSPVPMVVLWGAEGILIYNDGYAAVCGPRHPEALGGKVLEVWPEARAFNAKVIEAGLAGEARSFHAHELELWRYGHPEQVWMDLEYLPIRDEQGMPIGSLAMVFDITERVLAERRLATSEELYRFLDELGQAVAGLHDADEVLAETTRRVGLHLGISNCAYADMDADEDGFTIRGDWHAEGSRSIVGHYSLADFGHLAVQELSAGRPLIINNNRAEITPEEAKTFQDIGIAATICMPLIKNGRLAALMAIHDKVPRTWTDRELQFAREVTERSWAHIERVGAEANLRASEKTARVKADELKGIYDASPVGLAVLDRDLRYVRVNERLAQLNGVSAEDHIGRTVAEIVPNLTDQAQAVFDRVLAGETLWALEIVGSTRAKPDVTSTWRENWLPLRDDTGEIVGIAISCEDVTEERNAQRAIETMNRVGAAVVAEHDLERLVQMVTDAGVELTGAEFGAFFYNLIDCMGESYMLYSLSGVPREAFAQFPMPRNTQVFAPTFNGEGIVRSDDIIEDPRYGQNSPQSGMPEGHLPVRSYLAVPVMGRDGAVLGGLFFGHPAPGRFLDRHEKLVDGLAAQASIAIENARLIDRVKAANEHLERKVDERTRELTEAHEALRQSQKMEAIGQLTGGVAHDFNNLLTPIIGSLDIVKNKVKDDPRSVRLIDGAYQAAQHAATLVQRLLAFARRQPLQPKAVDLVQLVHGMRELIESTVGPQIDLELDLPATPQFAYVDQNQIEMALLNLSVNARDAMPSGGSLTVRVATNGRPSHQPDLPDRHYLCLSVSDTGTGMDRETLSRATEPFFSTKPVGEGTGLGLSMAHGLASQLGGALLLRSEPGQGTTVELWLPAHEGGAAEAIEQAERGIEMKPALVLLVDDEDLVRITTAEMLRETGFEVVEAADGAAALRLVNEGLTPTFMVSDHVVPGMSGAALAKAVRDRCADTKILMISGFTAEDEDASEFACLSKPFAKDALANALAML
jgi:PAS domain S-box-containing protein